MSNVTKHSPPLPLPSSSSSAPLLPFPIPGATLPRPSGSSSSSTALSLSQPQLRVARLPVEPHAQSPVPHPVRPQRGSHRHRRPRRAGPCHGLRLAVGLSRNGVSPQPLLVLHSGSAGRVADLQPGLARRLAHTVTHAQPRLRLHVHRRS